VSPAEDAFGLALVEWARGARAPETVERDDGYMEEGAGPEVYLADVAGWPVAEQEVLGQLRGRVLDVGCGAGRVALELQRRGIDVVGLDGSPLAVEAARLRGVKSLWCQNMEALAGELSSFDALVLFGNNFGLFATPEGARSRLAAWAAATNPECRLFLESTAPYFSGAPGMDRTYYRRNVERGRSPGQVRLRYHYAGVVGEWFTWLFVSREEIRRIVRGTGWHITEILGPGPDEPYVAILAKG
jgi:SAM-dependent methyltransferase